MPQLPLTLRLATVHAESDANECSSVPNADKYSSTCDGHASLRISDGKLQDRAGADAFLPSIVPAEARPASIAPATAAAMSFVEIALD